MTCPLASSTILVIGVAKRLSINELPKTVEEDKPG